MIYKGSFIGCIDTNKIIDRKNLHSYYSNIMGINAALAEEDYGRVAKYEYILSKNGIINDNGVDLTTCDTKTRMAHIENLKEKYSSKKDFAEIFTYAFLAMSELPTLSNDFVWGYTFKNSKETISRPGESGCMSPDEIFLTILRQIMNKDNKCDLSINIYNSSSTLNLSTGYTYTDGLIKSYNVLSCKNSTFTINCDEFKKIFDDCACYPNKEARLFLGKAYGEEMIANLLQNYFDAKMGPQTNFKQFEKRIQILEENQAELMRLCQTQAQTISMQAGLIQSLQQTIISNNLQTAKIDSEAAKEDNEASLTKE